MTSKRKICLTNETEINETPGKVLELILASETGFSPTLGELFYRVSLTIEKKLNQLIALSAVAK